LLLNTINDNDGDTCTTICEDADTL
jgi:hypothetical protein